MRAPRILDWRPLRRNSLLGFARVVLPSGMILHDVVIGQSNDSCWALPPSRPMLDKNGNAIREGTKVKYSPIVSFRTKELRQKFSAAVVTAVRQAHPEAFVDGAP